MSFGDEWVVEVLIVKEIVDVVILGVEYVIEYYVLIKGWGWVVIVGELFVLLEFGDIVMFL